MGTSLVTQFPGILICRRGQGRWPLKITKKNQCDLYVREQHSVNSLVETQTKCQYETPYPSLSAPVLLCKENYNFLELFRRSFLIWIILTYFASSFQVAKNGGPKNAFISRYIDVKFELTKSSSKHNEKTMKILWEVDPRFRFLCCWKIQSIRFLTLLAEICSSGIIFG